MKKKKKKKIKSKSALKQIQNKISDKNEKEEETVN